MGIEYVASFIGSVWKKLAGWVAAQARRIITTASATFIGAYLVYLFAPPWKGVADWFTAHLPGVIGTASATFFGAYLAFLFALVQRRREEEKKNVGALNRGLFTVYQMWNALYQYEREHLDCFRERPDRWLNLTAIPIAPRAHSQFEVGELSFLLDKEANVFANIMLQESRFGLAIGLIERRSEVMLKVVFPRMDQANVGIREQRPLVEFERILGNGVVHQLQQYTDHIFAFVDADVPDLEAAFADLRGAAERLYPKRKFIRVDFNPGPNLPRQPGHRGR